MEIVANENNPYLFRQCLYFRGYSRREHGHFNDVRSFDCQIRFFGGILCGVARKISSSSLSIDLGHTFIGKGGGDQRRNRRQATGEKRSLDVKCQFCGHRWRGYRSIEEKYDLCLEEAGMCQCGRSYHYFSKSRR